jgi:hypothetical protein
MILMVRRKYKQVSMARDAMTKPGNTAGLSTPTNHRPTNHPPYFNFFGEKSPSEREGMNRRTESRI